MQKVINIAGMLALAVMFLCSLQDGLQKTLGPFDNVKVKYKWQDPKTGSPKCVAKAPGVPAVLCSQKNSEELNEYKLLREIPDKALAQVAYSKTE